MEFKLDRAFSYHRMNENSLLIRVLHKDDVLDYRIETAKLISSHFKDQIILNHGLDDVLIIWHSRLLTTDLIDEVRSVLLNIELPAMVQLNRWKLPVYYDDQSQDIKAVSKQVGRSIKEVIDLHQQSVYRVNFIGFLPGFPYLEGLPDELSIPRKKIPSLKVKQGSVAIAAGNCGIYTQESPGGWYVLGNCPVPLYLKKRDQPFLLTVNDQVEFYKVDLHTFKRLEENADLLDINQFKNG
ncbi:allophanate hydrolase subunit 1 [Flavobacteria bacterium BBFL7]|nr:allophanate hydrolase subunit 1 [Flavobacteria bacterium BBFL7]